MIYLALLVFSALHPLEPLTHDEINIVTHTIQRDRKFPKGAFFATVSLHEPRKMDMKRWKPGQSMPREAFAMVLDRKANVTYEAQVDIGRRKLVKWIRREGVQSLILQSEYIWLGEIVHADPRFKAAMAKRGITDPSKVWVDGWAPGTLKPGTQGPRLMRAVCYYQDGAINFYDRPIEGLTIVVDLNQGKVIDLVDTVVLPIPTEHTEFSEKALGPMRSDLKPLVITQPEGPSFTVNGHEVQWQKWKFRFVLDTREGLVLHDVSYNDAGNVRSVLYRGALSEMVVPYGDADPHWSWRSAFDEGEYGIGRMASPLEVGTDVPVNARLFDADFADDLGKAYTLPRAVALYERDAGMLWKHYDVYHDKNESRRGRQLVLSFITTIGNYDYAIQWIFNQDGVLEVACDLSGMMLPKGVPMAKHDDAAHARHHGEHVVAPYVAAPHHQHIFNFRLDMDVDGVFNRISELNTLGLPVSENNPHGNAMEVREILLERERAAARDVSTASSRFWRVSNNAKRSSLGYAPSYVLLPGGNTMPFVASEAPVRRRARFMEHHVYATTYQEGERHASGDYPNQGQAEQGLPIYQGDDESLVDQDLVLWYSVGMTHIPRPEEWPIMTVHHVGFKLLPAGFFDRNPALDVPR